jgi:copper chaperone CopZ
MKNNILSILSVIGFSLFVFSCNSKSEAEKISSFKVYGNCEMCKKTIDGSLKDVKGINSANWNVEDKTMTVSFDSTKTNMSEIHKQIASVGYDTELEKGNDDAYKALHECCQYDRK